MRVQGSLSTISAMSAVQCFWAASLLMRLAASDCRVSLCAGLCFGLQA